MKDVALIHNFRWKKIIYVCTWHIAAPTINLFYIFSKTVAFEIVFFQCKKKWILLSIYCDWFEFASDKTLADVKKIKNYISVGTNRIRPFLPHFSIQNQSYQKWIDSIWFNFRTFKLIKVQKNVTNKKWNTLNRTFVWWFLLFKSKFIYRFHSIALMLEFRIESENFIWK